MVRIFAVDDGKETINHVYGEIDPLRDIKVINMELILADLETIEKRISNLQKDVKRGDKIAIAENLVAKKIHEALLEEKMANTVSLGEDEEKIIRQLNLLTRKKFIYGLNKRSGGKNLDETQPQDFEKICREIESYGSQWVMIDAKTEHELSDFEGDDKIMMREEIGHNDDGIDTLIKKSYTLLGLATYFTTGEKETRAWTIVQNSLAPLAAAAIHTDFEKQFIRAEVVFWSDLLEVDSMVNAKAKGLVRTEGKEYVVKDGDVIEFKV